MRRVMPLLVFACLSAAACGGKSDEDKIKDSITQIGHAEATGDVKTVCAMMTPALQTLVAKSDTQGATTCQAALKDAAATMSPTEKNNLQHVKILNVKVNGDTAVVNVSPKGEFAADQPMRKV